MGGLRQDGMEEFKVGGCDGVGFLSEKCMLAMLTMLAKFLRKGVLAKLVDASIRKTGPPRAAAIG